MAQTIARMFQIHHSEIPIFIFSQALGLQEIVTSTDDVSLIESHVLPSPELGSAPLIYYLEAYLNCINDGLFIFLDLHKYLEPHNCDRAILSYLRTIGTRVYSSAENYKRMILLGQEITLTIELIRLIPIVELPLPSREKRLWELNDKLSKADDQQTPINLEAVTNATSGLTVREIRNQFDTYSEKCTLLGNLIIEDELIDHFVSYKIQLLKSLRIEVMPPSDKTFGGHNLLRRWLEGVREIIKPEARAYGLPFPKGCLLAGVSGVGKTLIAQSISNSWNLPLIKLSIPALKGGLVGESENNLKRALELIKMVEGVVLIDEIEKAVSRAGTDSSGVTGGMLSILLEYLNENEQHFVISTANDIFSIPSELMRKGRLDKLWFAGLPSSTERDEILKIHFFRDNRVADDYTDKVLEFFPLLVDRTENFSGAELAALVIEGLNNIYLEGRARKPQSDDFIPLIGSNPPLAVTQAEKHVKIMQTSQRFQWTSSFNSSWQIKRKSQPTIF